jgi:hypothetical protein
MNSYKIFANGVYWGIWPAPSAEEAVLDAAYDEGTEGDTTGIVATLMTEADWDALVQWREAGCPADKHPINPIHA